MEGKIVTKQEVFKGTAWAWLEGRSFKFIASIKAPLTNGFKSQGRLHQ